MKLQILIDLIKDNQKFLLKRILHYAKLYDYVKYTSTLEEAWIASVSGLSQTLVNAILTNPEVHEIFVDQDFQHSPMSSFGIAEAQKHRKRGVTLEMFLSLMKYYRQSYLDLIRESVQDLEHKYLFELWINRYFDNNEIAFCSEWNSKSKEKLLLELQTTNRNLTNEKNKYLTIFESISNPAFVLDNENYCININYAAQQLINESMQSPGYIYYSNLPSKLKLIQVLPWLYDEFMEFFLGGDLETSVEIDFDSPTQGLRNLSIKFSRMLDVSDKFQGTIILIEDLTERKKIEGQLAQMHFNELLKIQQEQLLKIEREKNEALENSIRLKDEFLYLISHEFKTPIAVISLALQSINTLYRSQISNNMGKLISTIGQNTNRQLRLVNNLLEITRINSGNLKIKKGIFDIVYLINSLVNSVEYIAEQKGVEIRFTSKFKNKEILVDEEKIERIILNLLSNALKFTPSGKSINVTVTNKKYKNKNMICISVQDEGIGIPKSKQALIFEKFGQVDTSLSRHAEGIGIGLHLVKLLVNALEAYIFLESEEQKGSNFTVLIPATKRMSVDQVPSGSNIAEDFVERESRIVKQIEIEFSDIYL
ncbi:sensor histidine kinase [Candidatus Clostridium radicumherbarum]|uniref:histidine kinase n=1 Tax=Candidatus Clostridium radicumherbarum TaxID=3381662 RepID=A0ABW8TR27_9CLOT